MKVQKSSGITPFGGLNFVLQEFESLNLGHILESSLPALARQSQYSWKDIFYAFSSIYFCGGDCMEDLSGNFSHHFKGNPLLNLPSPDCVSRRFRALSADKEILASPRGTKQHEFSPHDSLNKLNLAILKSLGFNKQKKLTLDYDNTLIFNEKKDSRYTYKKKSGYCPGVGIVGENIVYLENRNGNSDAGTLQHTTLERMFSLLEDQGITIHAFRADAASYQLEVVESVAKNVEKFYIRAAMNHALARAIGRIGNWEKVKVGKQEVYRGEVEFTPFVNTWERNKRQGLPSSYRLVVTKTGRDDRQTDMFTGEACNYSAILTSDREWTADQVVAFYNSRGGAEKEFDVMKNDFGWNRLPFSKLEQNTVYLLFTAICRNLYHYIINKFSGLYKQLEPCYRIKKFIFRFITIPAKWTGTARQYKLRIYGDLQPRT